MISKSNIYLGNVVCYVDVNKSIFGSTISVELYDISLYERNIMCLPVLMKSVNNQEIRFRMLISWNILQPENNQAK